MAETDEKAPLLDNDEEDDVVGGSRQQFKHLYERNSILNRNGAYSGSGEGAINISASTSVLKSVQLEVDQIVAIFVVAFDTKAGNIIEWCEPDDFDLDGVEFKAMASGSHTLVKDFVYFRKENLYGLACFENMPVESEIERGARMKSVGILATSYTLLYRHMQFLENQVRHLLHFNEIVTSSGNMDRHQLEIPGQYAQLQAFYEDRKGLLPSDPTQTDVITNSELLPELKITHPAGCFSQFMQFFGEQMFTLWKYCLLQKRILFFSPPPIGVVCYRVYCACCLGNHSLRNQFTQHDVKPHFYINVADIETIETEMAYIACTTEKIFETKTHLYDVYVDNQNIKSHIPALKDLLKVSDADRDKFQKLNNQRASLLYEADIGGEQIDDEEIFTVFFQEQNNRLFQTLLDVANSQDRQLTSDHMKSMGLDPTGDRAFLMELVETYGIDVMLMVDNPCCPR